MDEKVVPPQRDSELTQTPCRRRRHRKRRGKRGNHTSTPNTEPVMFTAEEMIQLVESTIRSIDEEGLACDGWVQHYRLCRALQRTAELKNRPTHEIEVNLEQCVATGVLLRQGHSGWRKGHVFKKFEYRLPTPAEDAKRREKALLEAILPRIRQMLVEKRLVRAHLMAGVRAFEALQGADFAELPLHDLLFSSCRVCRNVLVRAGIVLELTTNKRARFRWLIDPRLVLETL